MKNLITTESILLALICILYFGFMQATMIMLLFPNINKRKLWTNMALSIVWFVTVPVKLFEYRMELINTSRMIKELLDINMEHFYWQNQTFIRHNGNAEFIHNVNPHKLSYEELVAFYTLCLTIKNEIEGINIAQRECTENVINSVNN